MHLGILIVVFVVPPATATWAWLSLGEVLRRRTAQHLPSPRGLAPVLVATTAVYLVGAGSLLDMERIAGLYVWPLDATALTLYARVVLPTVAFIAIGVLAGLRRRHDLAALEAEGSRQRAEIEEAARRDAAFAGAVRASLRAPYEDLRRLTESRSSQKEDAVVRAMAGLDRLSTGLLPLAGKGDAASDAGVREACDVVLRRLERLIPTTGSCVSVFAPHGLRAAVEPDHLASLLLGVVRMAVAAADRDEPFVSIEVTERPGVVCVEVKHNGAPPGIENDGPTGGSVTAGLDLARAVATAYGGSVEWAGAPKGTGLKVLLPLSTVAARVAR